MGRVEFLNDSGDFLFLNFLLMLLELLHGLLHVLLLVSVSVDHVVVFLLQDLKLVLKLFDGLGVFFMFFNK